MLEFPSEREGTEAQRGKVAGLPSPGGKWPDWDLNSHCLALSPCVLSPRSWSREHPGCQGREGLQPCSASRVH